MLKFLKLLSCIAVGFVVLITFYLSINRDLGNTSNSDKTLLIDVQGDKYAIPEDYLGMVIPHPEITQDIVALHVHYPDLSPVGLSTNICPHKVALTDTKCPYFTIFLKPSNQITDANDGLIASAKFIKKTNKYEIYQLGENTFYHWIEADGPHISACYDPPSRKYIHDTVCQSWRKLPSGGSYSLSFSYSWREESMELDQKAAALVAKLYANAKTGQR